MPPLTARQGTAVKGAALLVLVWFWGVLGGRMVGLAYSCEHKSAAMLDMMECVEPILAQNDIP